ncbi:hypothetical protein ACHAWU_003673 [Discostella pseudostelligera]|uniref:Uncharacterized protein n=1 Tax=Discostella pseudostelligera TaxID=259834 RepID=A0ABD3M9I9_9STRA
MVIPPGEIYCAPCHSDGSTAVLEKYFDKVDYERSHFTCSRAYVVALLEEHMRQHPKGNVIVVDEDGAVVTGDNVDDGDNPNDPNGDDNKIWDDTAMLSRRRSQRLRRLLKNSPRSELWYPHELQAQIMLPNGDQGDECDEEIHKSKDGSMKNGDSEITDVTTSASFLVGKPIRLYNNLDNEYHVGRIVDWRKCTVYPRPTSLPPYEYIDAQTVRDEGSLMSPTHNQNDSKNNAAAVLNHISIDQLEYYGIGPLSTCEFLVRFPSGLQGRRKELLKWIMLEEHSLAVGMSLILGKKSKPSLSRSVDWKPAMILVRSALELVTVRSFLHEDDRGNLFATMTTERENTLAGDRWALASFFGEEQHDLLRLRDETCDLHDNPNLLLMDASGVNGKVKNEEGADRVEEADNDVQLLHPRDPPSSIDVPLALAMVEHCEQMRCKAWKKLLLRQPHHRYALVSSDEYSTQLHLEKDAYSTVSSKSKSDASIVKTTSNKSIRPLVERGLDRMWLAQLLLERAPPPPSVNSSPVPQQWSKDDLIHLQCERVLSVSQAMASLQR